VTGEDDGQPCTAASPLRGGCGKKRKKRGEIMNIGNPEFFLLTLKGSLRYSYAPFLASSHSSFGWGKSQTEKRTINTLSEARS